MEPITLKKETAKKVGMNELDRYRAEAQFMGGNPINSETIDGQLIIFEDHFSFVWLRERKHVIFERPSPERTIRLLRDIISKEDEQENVKNYLDRCYNIDEEDFVKRRHICDEVEPFRRIKLVRELKD
mmetsp:Transcript_11220/g.16016  ORF Transcript_11220/g.16016 Transcript_11220/m.16016 type:complete len:128 (+) Transcript_11220:674-1057(+)